MHAEQQSRELNGRCLDHSRKSTLNTEEQGRHHPSDASGP